MKGPSPCEPFGQPSAVPSYDFKGSDEPPDELTDVALGSYEPSHESYFHLKVHMNLRMNLFLHIKVHMKVQKRLQVRVLRTGTLPRSVSGSVSGSLSEQQILYFTPTNQTKSKEQCDVQ